MIRFFRRNLTPAKGYSHIAHILLVALMPVLFLVLIRLEFVAAAFTIFILSKWRIIAVRPRYWFTNLTLGLVDIMFGLGVLIAIISTDNPSFQVIWTVLYAFWLLYVKPQSSKFFMGVQSIAAQTVFLGVIVHRYSHYDALVFVTLFWVVCYFAAKHFLSAFDEDGLQIMAGVWGLFAAQIGWIASHWLIFFGVIAQPVLLISILSIAAMSLYYLDHEDRLSLFARRQILLTTAIILTIIIALSDWGDKVV